jgi:hypothetical protein
MYLASKLSLILLLFPAILGFGPGEKDKSNIEQSLGKLPLYFVENRGQMDDRVNFYVQGSDKTLFFTSECVTFALSGKEGEEHKQRAVKLDFQGAQENVKPRGEDKQEAIFSYFKGKPEEWNIAIPTFGKLVYTNSRKQSSATSRESLKNGIRPFPPTANWSIRTSGRASTWSIPER